MCTDTIFNLELRYFVQNRGYNGFSLLIFIDLCWGAPCKIAFNSLVTETSSSGHKMLQDKSEASESSNHSPRDLSPEPV